MKEIPISRLEDILNAQLVAGSAETCIDGAVIDSRKAAPGKLFIPIAGENHDGHDFIKDAIDGGASAVISEKTPKELGLRMEDLQRGQTAFFVTGSTVRAMRRLAAFNRDRAGIPVIALTGSSGKTTTKDLIAAVLEQKYHVHKTQGNLNNIYGVPQTMLSIEPEDEVAVVEMGMDHIGEIEQSIRFVKPEIAIITNIGFAHLQQLGSQANILKAKSEILETLTADNTAILNGDDDYLNQIEAGPFKITRYGLHADRLNIKAENCRSGADGVSFDVNGHTYHLRFPGEHNIYNALCAVAVADAFGLTPEQIQQGFDRYTPSEHRMDITEKDGITYIDDSYNANPDSMKAALRTLSDYAGTSGRKVAVLGDMFELGDKSLIGHLEVGREAAKQADYLVGIGENARNIIRGAIEVRAGMDGKYFKDTAEATQFLMDFLEPGDTVLFKASHGMHFDDMVSALAGEA